MEISNGPITIEGGTIEKIESRKNLTVSGGIITTIDNRSNATIEKVLVSRKYYKKSRKIRILWKS